MAKTKIYLFISDIASFIGQNPYDYVKPFERLWKKCDAENYERLVKNAQNLLNEQKTSLKNLETEKSKLDADVKNESISATVYEQSVKVLEEKKVIVKDKVEKTEKAIADIVLTQEQKLEKLVGADVIKKVQDTQAPTENKRVVIDNAINKLNLNTKERVDIMKQAESYVNKTHGTIYENNAIKLFENKVKVKLDTSQVFNKYYLEDVSRNSAFDWYICGRVDGLCEDYIVEVKNRTKSFFSRLRDYEKTQIHMYMRMLSKPHAKLVECLRGKIRITDITEDVTYTANVLEYLGIFINHFENEFLNNTREKEQFLSSNEDQKRTFIHKMFLVPIQRHIDGQLQGYSDSEECMIDDLD